MIAFIIGIVVGVVLRGIAPFLGYPFSDPRSLLWWSAAWNRVPQPRGVFLAIVALTAVGVLTLAVIVLPLMFVSEYHLALMKWWGFSYSRVALVGIGAVLGFASAGLMFEARRSDAANIPVRAGLLGGAVLLAGTIGHNYDTGGDLFGIAKISTAAVAIEFSN